MKRFISFLIGFVLIFSCSQKIPEPIYQPGSMEYQFFMVISDSLEIPDLNPKRSVPLIEIKGRSVLSSSNPTRSGPLVEKKVLTVYSSDILEEVYYKLKPYAANKKKPTKKQIMDLYQGTARNNAARQMFLAAAEENDISISEEKLNAEMNKYTKQFGGEGGLHSALQQQNKTIEDFKEQISEMLIINIFMDDMYYNRVQVDEDTLHSLYNAGRTATVRHILFMTQNKSPSDKKAIRKKADEILARAKAGEDFAQLAKTYSDDPGSKNNGGLYKDFERGKMVKPFEEASFNLPIGSISDLVETRYGYHIIKIIERKKEERPFDEVKKEIHVRLARQKEPSLFQAVIEELKEKYKYKELFSLAEE